MKKKFVSRDFFTFTFDIFETYTVMKRLGKKTLHYYEIVFRLF